MKSVFEYYEGYHFISVITLSILVNLFIRGKLSDYSFLVLLSLSFLIEIILSNLLMFLNKNNYLAINFYCFISVPLYLNLFRVRSKKNTFIIWILYLIAHIFSIQYLDYTKSINSKLYLLGMCLVFMNIIRYFYSIIFQSNSRSKLFDYKIPLGIGISLFVVCSFPLLFLLDNLVLENDSYSVFYRLLTAGNYILSTGFLISSIMLWRVNS